MFLDVHMEDAPPDLEPEPDLYTQDDIPPREAEPFADHLQTDHIFEFCNAWLGMAMEYMTVPVFHTLLEQLLRSVLSKLFTDHLHTDHIFDFFYTWLGAAMECNIMICYDHRSAIKIVIDDLLLGFFENVHMSSSRIASLGQVPTYFPAPDQLQAISVKYSVTICHVIPQVLYELGDYFAPGGETQPIRHFVGRVVLNRSL